MKIQEIGINCFKTNKNQLFHQETQRLNDDDDDDEDIEQWWWHLDEEGVISERSTQEKSCFREKETSFDSYKKDVPPTVRSCTNHPWLGLADSESNHILLRSLCAFILSPFTWLLRFCILLLLFSLSCFLGSIMH